jgi:hypothetical protein
LGVQAFWNLTVCCWMSSSWHFEVTYCFYPQGSSSQAWRWTSQIVRPTTQLHFQEGLNPCKYICSIINSITMSKEWCIYGLHCIADDVPSHVVHYCERFLELVIDLEALLPTRRFFNTVFDDCHMVVRCHLSKLPHLPEGNLFTQVGNARLLFTV